MRITLVLALVALLTVVPLLPPRFVWPAGLAVLALTAAAWRRREPAAGALGLVFSASILLGLAGLGPQQPVLVVAFAVYALALRRAAWLRPTSAWLRAGSVDGTTLALAAGIAASSAVALLAWHALVRPDLSAIVRAFVPDWPLWLLVAGALLLALVNAAVEEAAYRGVALGALDAALGAGAVAVVLQAVAFGALHYRAGFPSGAPGALLAMIYGLLLAALRRRSDGLLAPWTAHVLTDLAIFAIVLTLGVP